MKYRPFLYANNNTHCWLTSYKSVREAVGYLSSIYYSLRKLYEIETDQANEFAYRLRVSRAKTMGSVLLIVDETHPLFNAATFIYSGSDNYEEQPWGDEKHNYINKFIESAIQFRIQTILNNL